MSLFDPLYIIYEALTNPQQAPILIAAISQIILSWLVYGAVFTGIGAGMRRAYGLRLVSVSDWIIAFWVGWSASLLFLQGWHLVQPVNMGAFGIIALVGVAGLAVNIHDLISIIRRVMVRWRWSLLLIGISLLFANSALGPPSEADFALYHQQSILWTNAYPAVPGLGNLHGRLAFNNAMFVYAALTNVAPFQNIGNHVAASLLIMALTVQAVYGLYRVVKGDTRVDLLFTVLFFPVIGWLVTNNEYIRTPDNDLPAIVLGMVLGALVLRVLAASDDPDENNYPVFVTIAMSAAGVACKLSFAGTALGVLALVLWRYRHNLMRVKLVIWSVGFGLAMAVVWMWRGIILSGYPLYPSTVGALPVDWRIPCDLVISERDWVYSWARMPGAPPSEVLGSWAWLRPWVVRTLRIDRLVFTPLLIALVGLVVWLRMGRPLNRTWAFMGIPVMSLVFWFMLAPDPRFAGAVFWLLAFGLAALILSHHAKQHPAVARTIVIMLALLLTYDTRGTFLTYPPAVPDGFHRPPQAELAAMTTDSGLTVNVVITERVNGPGLDERCYDADLPCTPYFNADLQARDAGDLGQGFRFADPLTCDVLHEASND